MKLRIESNSPEWPINFSLRYESDGGVSLLLQQGCSLKEVRVIEFKVSGTVFVQVDRLNEFDFQPHMKFRAKLPTTPLPNGVAKP